MPWSGRERGYVIYHVVSDRRKGGVRPPSGRIGLSGAKSGWGDPLEMPVNARKRPLRALLRLTLYSYTFLH